MEEDYVVDCKNEDCSWSGLASECIYYDAEYYCPKCGEFVEPATVFSKQDWLDLYNTLIDFKRRVILRHSGDKEGD